MAGIALNFIAKTQEQADEMVARYEQYFDGIEYEVGIITESFSDVRNRVLERTRELGYDYMFWCDTDDEVDGLDHLRGLTHLMAERGVNALYFPYEYAFNEQGECIVLQWRERIVDLHHPFTWLGAIHESLISVDKPLLDRSEEIVVRHSKTIESHHDSAARNHKILMAEYRKPKRDPRITHYLALSYFNLGQYNKAIKLFREHIRTSGWDEDQYRSYFYIGQAYGMLDKNKDVLQAATDAMGLIPARPEAYVLAATAEFELGHYDKCLEWLMVAGQKPAPKDSLSAIDPTYYTYKAEFLAAQAYLRMGKVKEAHEQLKLVLQHSPNFQAAVQMAPLFQEIYDDQVAVTRLTWLTDYLKHYGGKAVKLFESLPARLMADPRLNAIRQEILPPKQWPNRSIVFFCGQSLETWGPETLSDGMSGSEEAIVYLSRALAEAGWDVTIYNDREQEYIDTQTLGPIVTYKPWTTFNPNDEFDVIVAWRNPGFFREVPIKARVKAADLHDMPNPHFPVSEWAGTLDAIFVKSKFHAAVYDAPAEKTHIISNGVQLDQLQTEGLTPARRPHSVGYFSSYDRGLELLLKLWPSIRERVPDATLDIYYGWVWFDALRKDDPEAMKWKFDILKTIAKLKKQGVTEHGRVDHETLGKAMQEMEVWAYPTAFEEINCITAIKAGLAGMIPVTSGYAALAETVQEPQPDYGQPVNDLYTNKHKQDEFVERLVAALVEGRTETERIEMANRYTQFAWEGIAGQWNDSLSL